MTINILDTLSTLTMPRGFLDVTPQPNEEGVVLGTPSTPDPGAGDTTTPVPSQAAEDALADILAKRQRDAAAAESPSVGTRVLHTVSDVINGVTSAFTGWLFSPGGARVQPGQPIANRIGARPGTTPGAIKPMTLLIWVVVGILLILSVGALTRVRVRA